LALLIAKTLDCAITDEGKMPTSMKLPLQDDWPQGYAANENWYLYKQTIERITPPGVKHYHFSIPWTRILPFVLDSTPVNQQRIDSCDDLNQLHAGEGNDSQDDANPFR
jgi:beta-glucosidase/6-phospho-beta-glucosidase/beta-galactosidase